MPSSPLEKLEQLIPALLDETRRLRQHNAQQSEELERLRARVKTQSELQGKWDADRQRLGFLEKEQRKYEGERDELRNRVQGLLEELENTDFL